MAIEQGRTIEFSQPFRQIVSMIAVLILVAVGVFFLYGPISAVFGANPYLNGFIGGVFIVGVLACFWQVIMLVNAVNWLEGFAIDRPGHEFVEPPRLLLSLSALLRDRRARSSLTATSTRSILDSVATRLDEMRDITRYISNLLILVGLLGTFWGLSNVVPGIVSTMQSLTTAEGQDGFEVFNNLMAGLNEQLDGMGTAFASSLLGLAGSLVVGLLDLFTGHGQNRFYRELEEWLSSITRISVGDSDSGQTGADPYVAEVMEKSSRQIEGLVKLISQAEERRMETNARLTAMTSALNEFATRIGETAAPAQAAPALDPEIGAKLDRVAVAQEQIAALLQSRTDEGASEDAESRLRLRNIDVQLLRILEEISAGRQDSTGEIRADLNRLTRAVIELGGDGAEG